MCAHVYMIRSKYFFRCVYSAFGISNRYGLGGPGSDLVESEIFRTPPDRSPAFYKIVTGSLSRG